MSFDALLRAHPWQPIPGCPGRYVLRPPTAATPEELLGGGVLFVEQRVAAARDPVIVVQVDGGGLISYRRDDGRFVHTLGDDAGFVRKLDQFGIQLSERERIVRLHAAAVIALAEAPVARDNHR